MRKYDLVVILDPELKAEEQEKLQTKVKKFITDAAGQVVAVEGLGKKNLTAEINKRETGVYFHYRLALSPAQSSVLRRKLEREESVLRYLLISG